MKCPAEKYLCDNGATCISKDLLCNGNRDCRDGSDETDCSVTSKINSGGASLTIDNSILG